MIPRNPVIAKLFRCARLCETAGYGFDKMLLWQKKGGLKVHFFDDKQDLSRVVFERIVSEPPQITPPNCNRVGTENSGND
jgi:predicted HTH transcriptional regulator